MNGRCAQLSVCAALALAATAVTAAPLSREAVDGLYREGSDLFRQANEQAGRDAEKAAGLYRDAALRFERIVREGGVENGRLYYNIGNAYFRMNDIGRAILNYRRAQLLSPNDANLHQNLQYARARRFDRIEERQETRILKTVFFWHYDLPPAARATAFLCAFGGLWLAALARLFVRRSWLTGAISVLALVSLLMGGSLTFETVSLRMRRPGVIVSPEVVARKGDSATYEPAFKEALHTGTEFTLIERRSSWLHVELADGRPCWVPADAVELVR